MVAARFLFLSQSCAYLVTAGTEFSNRIIADKNIKKNTVGVGISYKILYNKQLE